jgi:hypothetical protein
VVLFVYRKPTIHLITEGIFSVTLEMERNKACFISKEFVEAVPWAYPLDTEDGGNTMSLLSRIAISNGNKLRKSSANLAITIMDAKKVADWNRSLRNEIYLKKDS